MHINTSTLIYTCNGDIIVTPKQNKGKETKVISIVGLGLQTILDGKSNTYAGK